MTFLPIKYFDIIEEYFNIHINKNLLPIRYWNVAVPTHLFVSLFYIFLMIMGYNFYITVENPIKEGKYNNLNLDFFYKKLSEAEMMKEVKYDKVEG